MEIVVIILSLSLVSCLVAFLTFFYFREKRQYLEKSNEVEAMKQFFTEVNKKSEAVYLNTFNSYLKHINNLEKMVLPKPVTQKMVEDVLGRTPPIVKEIFVENEIEKVEEEGIKITENNLGDIPFGKVNVIVEEGNGKEFVV